MITKNEIKSIDVGRDIAQTILLEHQSIRAMRVNNLCFSLS